MIALRTKLLGPGEETPVTTERTHQVAIEAVLDTGEGFKITVYLDSNGDFTIKMDGNPIHGEQLRRTPSGLAVAGKWK